MITPAQIKALKPGDTLIYNDGRKGHTGILATVIEVLSGIMFVQFADRADPTMIALNAPEWMDHLNVVGSTKPATTHSPGPWHYGELFNPASWNGRAVYGIGNGAEHIGYASVTGCIDENQALANARLIAAAPDLLRCLVRLEIAFDESFWEAWCDMPEITTDQQVRGSCLSEARAAIAKATGQ